MRRFGTAWRSAGRRSQPRDRVRRRPTGGDPLIKVIAPVLRHRRTGRWATPLPSLLGGDPRPAVLTGRRRRPPHAAGGDGAILAPPARRARRGLYDDPGVAESRTNDRKGSSCCRASSGCLSRRGRASSRGTRRTLRSCGAVLKDDVALRLLDDVADASQAGDGGRRGARDRRRRDDAGDGQGHLHLGQAAGAHAAGVLRPLAAPPRPSASRPAAVRAEPRAAEAYAGRSIPTTAGRRCGSTTSRLRGAVRHGPARVVRGLGEDGADLFASLVGVGVATRAHPEGPRRRVDAQRLGREGDDRGRDPRPPGRAGLRGTGGRSGRAAQHQEGGGARRARRMDQGAPRDARHVQHRRGATASQPTSRADPPRRRADSRRDWAHRRRGSRGPPARPRSLATCRAGRAPRPTP